MAKINQQQQQQQQNHQQQQQRLQVNVGDGTLAPSFPPSATTTTAVTTTTTTAAATTMGTLTRSSGKLRVDYFLVNKSSLDKLGTFLVRSVPTFQK